MYILLGRKPNNVNYKERGIYIFYSDIINESYILPMVFYALHSSFEVKKEH